MTIRLIEELSFNALPALQSVYYDGWLLRLTDGYPSRRVNSVNPLYPPSLDLDEKIAYCEQVYRSSGRATIFKLTAAALPGNLDAVLTERGYVRQAETSVQILDLSALTATVPDHCVVESSLSPRWLAHFCRLNHLDDQRANTLGLLLPLIVPPIGCALVKQNERIVGVGLGVLERGWMGIYDVVVDERVRNQGVGVELMRGLLAWGRANGAQNAYLQVMRENAPALRLYEKLGFQELYRYWYRVRS